MKTLKAWWVLSCFVVATTASFAQLWGPWQLVSGAEEGQGAGIDVSFTEARSRDGQIWGRFRNRTDLEYSIDIKVGAVEWDGKPYETRLSTLLKPRATLAGGGLWVPAKKVLSFQVLECRPTKTPSTASTGASGNRPGPGGHASPITFSGHPWMTPPAAGQEAAIADFGKVTMRIERAVGHDEVWMQAKAFGVRALFQIRLQTSAGGKETVETVTRSLGNAPLRIITAHRILSVKVVQVEKAW